VLLDRGACLLDVSGKGPYVLFTAVLSGQRAASFKSTSNQPPQTLLDYLALVNEQGSAYNGWNPNAAIVEAVDGPSGAVVTTRLDFQLADGTTFDTELLAAEQLSFMLQREPDAPWLDVRFPGSGVSTALR